MHTKSHQNIHTARFFPEKHFESMWSSFFLIVAFEFTLIFEQNHGQWHKDLFRVRVYYSCAAYSIFASYPCLATCQLAKELVLLNLVGDCNEAEMLYSCDLWLLLSSQADFVPSHLHGGHAVRLSWMRKYTHIRTRRANRHAHKCTRRANKQWLHIQGNLSYEDRSPC